MNLDDVGKMTFITDLKFFRYIMMAFSLKIAGSTYRHFMNDMFENKIGHNLEVYVDNMLAKSKQCRNHTKDLREIFEVLKKYRKRLNPKKCIFGVESGKFLSFLITKHGIETNPDKVEAIQAMTIPTKVKEL